MTTPKFVIAAALASLLGTASGCVISDGSGHHDNVEPDPYQTFHTAIDADYVLNTDLGYGAGLFVEYTSGGEWELWTSCDTKATGTTCNFEVNVTADGTISNVQQFELEASDNVELYNDNALSLYTTTGTRSDAVRFSSDAGSDLQVEVLLDGIIAPEYLVWFSDGLVHDGATGSPVVFQPSAP